MKKAIHRSVVLFTLLAMVSSVIAAPGDLDLTFSGDGKFTFGTGTGNSTANDTVIQSDGKIIVVGEASTGTTQQFAVIRYNSDGSLDPTFEDDGKVFTDFPGSISARATAVGIQNDGKIVVAGSMANGSLGFFAVARYNVDGSLDPTFDGDGRITFAFGSLVTNTPYDLVIQADQKIVIVGETGPSGNPPPAPMRDFAVARINSNGSLDTDFDGDGKVNTDFLSRNDQATGVAVQPDGKIVVVGAGGSPIAPFQLASAARYNIDGSLDTTFDVDGRLQFNSSVAAVWTDVAVQSDGLIVCPGQFLGTNMDFIVQRFNSNGTLQDQAAVPIGTGNDFADEVLLQPDGKVVVTGFGDFPTGVDFEAIRLNSDFTLDTSFSGDGKARSDVSSSSDTANGAALQPDGKLVIVGNAQGSVARFGMIRYGTDGTLDTSLELDGTVVTVMGIALSAIHAVATQSDGKILLGGVTTPTPGFPTFTLIRLNPNGSFDTTFDSDGIALAPGLSTGRAIALQSDGKIVMAGHSIGSFQVARFNTDGSLDTTFNPLGGQPGTITIDLNPSFDDRALAVAIASNGSIIVAGEINTTAFIKDVAVIRLNANGTRDLSFNGGGLFQLDTGSNAESARGIALQTDGKIVLATNAFEDTNEDFGIIRLNENGAADTSFGGDGLISVEVGGGNDFANAILVQVNGSIVVAGRSTIASSDDMSIIRLTAGGSLDTTFSGDGKAITPVGSGNDQINSLICQADGKILAGGFATVGVNRDFAVVRYNTDGSLDSAPLWGTSGIATADLGSTDSINAMAFEPGGKVVVAGESGGNIAAARFLGALGPTAGEGSIVGRVTDQYGNGISGVVVSVNGPSGRSAMTRSSSLGYFTISGLLAGTTYVITPSKKGVVFEPGSIVVNLTDGLVEVNFAGVGQLR